MPRGPFLGDAEKSAKARFTLVTQALFRPVRLLEELGKLPFEAKPVFRSQLRVSLRHGHYT